MHSPRPPTTSWCLFRDDPDLRIAIEIRKKQRKLTLVKIGRDIEVDDYRIGRYLNRRKPNLNQHQLFKLALYLGIEPSLSIEFK